MFKHSTPTPTDEELQHVHPAPSVLLHPNIPADKFYHLVMKEKLWRSWSGDSFGVKYLSDESTEMGPFEVDVKGKSLTIRDKMILQDSQTKTPIAIMYAMFLKWETTFKIYTFTANVTNQTPSNQKHEDRDLYEWAECKVHTTSAKQPSLTDAIAMQTQDKFFSVRKAMKTVDGVEYVMDGVGNVFDYREMRITRDGTPCVHAIEKNLGIFTGNQWELKIGPGIDPCLIVAFMAIMDEMNENK